MNKRIECITKIMMNENRVKNITIGKIYECLKERNVTYLIKNDLGEKSSYCKTLFMQIESVPEAEEATILNNSEEVECISGCCTYLIKGNKYKVIAVTKNRFLIDDDKDNIKAWYSKHLFRQKKENINKAKNEEADKRYGLWGDFQTIDLMKEILLKEEYIGFLKGNILKYKLRDKGSDEQDRIKAQDYQRELNKILKDGND